MEPVMWMFANQEDVDCDVKMLVELRTELTEETKHLDRIMVAKSQRCSELFKEQCDKLDEPIQSVKALRQWDRVRGRVVR